jgi:phosphoribosylformimino-5-aminoimidazole carboxamide ribotide isomerase
MIILPAIDILDGLPVRLYQGDYNQSSQVAKSVLDTAIEFSDLGAEYIHIVDLNGAKEGSKINADLICSVAKTISTPIEVGGGIRDLESISFYLNHGVSRVILGTSALKNEALLDEALRLYGSKIAVGLDCKDGYVLANGWLEASKEYYLDFAKRMETKGVSTLIFTDISKDGTLMGPNLDMLKKLKNYVDCQIIASGGIRDINHIQSLKDLELYGAITGKAMYSRTLDLKEAMTLCKE